VLGMKSLGGSGEIVVTARLRTRRIALRDEPARGHYHQRDGFFGGAGNRT